MRRLTKRIRGHNTVAMMADKLGNLKAQIAELETEMDTVRTKIIESGRDVIEGDFFRVTVSQVTKEILDIAALREKVSPAIIANCTGYNSMTMVRCVARTGELE